MAAVKYADDVAFLKTHTDLVELSAYGGKAVVAPDFQGRVMTSTLGRSSSFGWLNRGLISALKDNPSFNNYGGEDRFWLGPEAGQFALWFEQGQPFDVEHWHTPPGLNSTPYRVVRRTRKSVEMAAEFTVVNYSSTAFRCSVARTISMLSGDHAADHLGATVPAGVKMVGFESRNTLTNAGTEAWKSDTGLVSIWVLGMFKGLPHGKVIVPFVPGDEGGPLGARATTDYFGQIPPERCSVGDDAVFFTCDACCRGKIGVSPARSRGVLGSFDPDSKVLTIVRFNQPVGAAKLPYVNSLWQLQDAPYAGDAVNSYNDSPPAPDSGNAGSFYELETSSPAASLAPGQSITHVHRTYHFSGDVGELGELAVKALGVDLRQL